MNGVLCSFSLRLDIRPSLWVTAKPGGNNAFLSNSRKGDYCSASKAVTSPISEPYWRTAANYTVTWHKIIITTLTLTTVRSAAGG